MDGKHEWSGGGEEGRNGSGEGGECFKIWSNLLQLLNVDPMPTDCWLEVSSKSLMDCCETVLCKCES